MATARHELRQYLEALLIAAIFLGFSNTFLIKTFYIPSGSMEQTLLIGDHLFVNRFIYGATASSWERRLLPIRETRRGDVVIFRSPEEPSKDLVKRCIGLPGDEIRIVNKQLYVNGERVDDSAYAQHIDIRVLPNDRRLRQKERNRDNFSLTVPEGHYFFLGDNRDASYDSRFWGAVPEHYLKGRAQLIYWSYAGNVSDGTWGGWWQKLGQVAETLVGLPFKTRWDRTFHLVR